MLKGKKKTLHLLRSTDPIINYGSTSNIDDTSFTVQKKSWWTFYLGIFYVFMASVSILLSNVFVKRLSYIDSGQLSVVRSIGVFIGCLPIAIYSSDNILGPKQHFWMLVVRSILDSTALYLNIMAYRLLNLADASIILATVPALVTITARFYLKEPCGFIQIIAIIITIIGILISVRIPEISASRSVTFTKDYVNGLACAFGCALTLTFSFVSLRKVKDIHFSVILIYFGAIGAVENATITSLTSTFSWCYCKTWDSVQVILIGIFGFLGHCFVVLSFQTEIASISSTSRAAIDIIVSSIFQIIFFNSIPDYYIFGGGILVFIAIVLLGFWKWLDCQSDDSVFKSKMKWMLTC